MLWEFILILPCLVHATEQNIAVMEKLTLHYQTLAIIRTDKAVSCKTSNNIATSCKTSCKARCSYESLSWLFQVFERKIQQNYSLKLIKLLQLT